MSQKFASMDELFEALSHSAFRSKFRLSYADRTYAETRIEETRKTNSSRQNRKRASKKRRQANAL